MTMYRKTALVEALQWTGMNDDEMTKHLVVATEITHEFVNNVLVIGTLEGDMIANTGDYICVGNAGDAWPVREDIFEATYEEAS
jgi:hypothetical protein